MAIIGGMVDDRAMRFRQGYGAPAPKPAIRQPRPTPKPVDPEPTPQRREDRTIFGQPVDYDRNARHGKAIADFLNPAPSLTSAVAERRAPKPADVALDAGLFAAGFIPFAGPGIRASGQAARLGAIGRRAAPAGGPEAVSEFLGGPISGYRSTLNRDVLKETLNSGEQIIPRGRELVRMPSSGQVAPKYGSQSVPLPREIGADYIAGRPQSFGQAADLQRMGAIMRGLDPDTGGNIWRAPGLMSITAMEDLPGLIDLPAFLAKYSDEIAASPRKPLESDFLNEGLLSPDVRLQLRDFNPGDIDRFPLSAPTGRGQLNFPTWYFDAYAR